MNYHNAVIVAREPDTNISGDNSPHSENDFKVGTKDIYRNNVISSVILLA